jgi:extracellular elastinolytic metalloproteinase
MRAPHGRAFRLAISTAVILVVAGIATPVGIAAAAPSHAATPTSQRWKGHDARAQGAPAGVSARVADARVALAKSLGSQSVLQSDRTTGTLRFVGRLDGYLTGPSSSSAASVAMSYVRAHMTAFGLSAGDLATLHLRRDYVDVLGTHHLSWTQSAGGLELFGQGLSANVTKAGRLINVTGGPMPGLRAPAGATRLTPSAAISAARAGADARVQAPQARDTASRVLFPSGRGALSAWKTITFVSPSETDLSIVDDASGRVLYRHNLTDAATGVAQAWQVYPSDLLAGGNVARSVTFPVYDGTALNGNNAHAYLDIHDDDVADPGDEVPAVRGTDWSDYEAPLDFTLKGQNCKHTACTWDLHTAFSWEDNLAHNAVQVYHFLNRYHQHLLQNPIGFTEAAGNFEQHNSTGKGLGGDAVLGQSSDGADTAGGFPDLGHVDNANMTTFPDGTAPRMQMYLFRKFAIFGLPDVVSSNGGDDAEVVYHEYTHGLSNRLVIYPDGNSGLDNLQAGAMGEAWSDWYALDFVNDEGFKPDPPGDGNFIMGQYTFGGDLRSQPVDCPVGAPASACPGAGDAGPGGYTYGDFGKIAGAPEVHADGEIWLETLWDLRNALGSNLTEKLVTRGMELSPPSPSFLDMRNAIVQADLVATGGANADAIWETFAHRGMGYFAVSVNSGDDVHPVEDFSTPPTCGPCFTVSGRITDSGTGEPVEGMTVGIAGLDSGFGWTFQDTTNANGRYRLEDVPEHTVTLEVRPGHGYETLAKEVLVDQDVVVNAAVDRDWAALSGGATLVSFTPPDYAPFCGSNANGAFDLLLGNGWPSDAPGNGSSGVSGPRQATVRLPTTVDISSFGVASGGACGDGPDSGFKAFTIKTKTAGGSWQTAVSGKATPDWVLRTYMPTGGTQDVVAIRFIMRTNWGNPAFMDGMEVTVRGAPS